MKLRNKKANDSDLLDILPQAINSFKKNLLAPFFGDSESTEYSNERPPYRSELFTEEQLKQHAKAISKKHDLITKHPSELLLKRLAENEKILLQVHKLLTEIVSRNERIVPAAEWLLDNFYLIEEQIYIGKKHLPKGYSKGLPQLARGESAGLPRIYDIAVEIISHSDGHIDLNNLTGFINSYQTNTYLKIGELWAFPIMLRLALIENLRRLSIQISFDITNKALADDWADKLISTAENDTKNLVLVIADMARSSPPMVSSFVAELARRLQEKGSNLSLPVNWIEQQLSEHGLTIDKLVQEENQKQAADQVSISNSITSLRFLGSTEWREFVESTSIIEQTLKEDINGVYVGMDFYTRDLYRHSIEKIAKHSNLSEEEVAKITIANAKANDNTNDPGLSHVGYYLVGKGLSKLEKQAKMKVPAAEKFRKMVNRFPFFVYLFGIILLTASFSYLLIRVIHFDTSVNAVFILSALLCVIVTNQLAISIINWITTIFSRPSLLPRMNFSKGIPDEYRTMVVVPTLLNSKAGINSLIENLEVRFLANRDRNLFFALATDFADADQEVLPEDKNLLIFIKNKIFELNRKYQRSSNDTFFLFHRPRKWNAREKKWIGHERKRGKLEELNKLVLNKTSHDFMTVIGDENIFKTVKFIITLDTDTQLPRDSAWKMIGTMAHPMNHAIFSEKKKRVTQGYSILQPRVSNSLPAQDSSIYAKIHGNEPGTDPYTRAVSDVYQDLFDEGSFIGKGIYDIAVFDKVLDDKFPENRILSHDLVEGCYARSGLISDVQLYEEYPTQYTADMQRRHRWVRGDWQIAGWIFPFVKGYDKKFHKNPLSLLSKWKIFDNLRRSLVPLSFLVLFICGWLISSAPYVCTLSIVLVILVPSVIDFVWQLFMKPADVIFSQHFIFSYRIAKDRFIQLLIDIATLPYETYLNTDAIIRTLWRVLISGKNLLQWNPYNSNQKPKSIFRFYERMWFSPLFALGIFCYLTIYSPFTLVFAIPLIVLWLFAPFIAWFVSKPAISKDHEVSEEQVVYLRKLARKIWLFFETFVTAEDNWLPPDNYQEQPVERIAHRTSPTNIGMSLLSNLTAYDFGYITTGQLLLRTSNTIRTMQSMEKFRGHLYNWYDTTSLVPLAPKYVSTVDSGNLAGHLITLKQGLLMLVDKKVSGPSFFEGTTDVINILIEKSSSEKAKQSLTDFNLNMNEEYPQYINNITDTKQYLDKIQISFSEIISGLNPAFTEEELLWSQKAKLQITEFSNEMLSLCPWILLPAIPPRFIDLLESIPAVPTIRELSRMEETMLNKIVKYDADNDDANENEWLDNFRKLITESGRRAKEIIITIEQLANRCNELANIEYDFIYNKPQHLLAIGYNVDEHRKDNSYYDLLASEARLATFVGIAQGQLPQDSWFSLGRQLTNVGNSPVLLSWSGSMFEYLMPLLVMPTYDNTLLNQTYKSIIKKQVEYGKKRDVPWGVSESGYNMVDASLNYQYKAFGIPGTGFKRGLGEDTVISPYSTIMALMVEPEEAYDNLQVLKGKGFEGQYGFYEAVDYTVSRLQRKQEFAIIRSFMAHHQGMSFLSLAYLLLNRPMQQRFVTNIQVKSTLLLLQERIPRVSTFYSPSVHNADKNIVSGTDMSMRVITTPNTALPEVQLLSNGRYHVMVTNSGAGYSRWKNIAVTRWREDTTCDNKGTFCYIRDLDIDTYWSAAYQPTLQQSNNYEAVFSQGRAEFRRTEFSLETHTEIVVSPEDDIELRRVHLTNRSRKKRTIEITSFAEVVLVPPLAEEMHPAFSNLFVETEIYNERHAIICTRRPRTAEEQVPWMFQLMKVTDASVVDISYETDRSKFIGRGNSVQKPSAMSKHGPLSNTDGPVLDPIVAMRYVIIIEPNASASIDIVMGIADTKQQCNILVDKYQDQHLTNRVLELAWTHSQVILRQINAVEADAQLYARLAGSIIFTNDSLRADAAVIMKNQRGQSGLWGYSISGDLPIVLLQIEDSNNIELVKQMIQAHAYWRMKGLMVDLIILNEDHGGYRQVLQNQIMGLLMPAVAADVKDQPGGIFIRSLDQVSNEDRILFQTVARVVISDRLGTLEEQITRRNKLKATIPYFSPTKFHASSFTSVEQPKNLQFFNGLGGFSPNGKEYVITTSATEHTPAPWSNILANPNFGSIITESGQSYTWIENAHEFRLTPWNNDPLTDLKGEAFYIRDEESGKFWSPAPLPARGSSPYITRHGFGYSVFEHSEDGIDSSMTVYADIEAPLKFIVIKLHNKSGRSRRLSATGYVEWILGDLKAKTQMHVITDVDSRSGAILARNAYNTEFEGRVAFFDVDDPEKNITTDRTEFIGRNGIMSNPDGLNRSRLSGRTGAALDPCGVMQSVFNLAEDQEKQLVFRLGAGRNLAEVLDVIKRTEGTVATEQAFQKVHQYWEKTLNTVKVETPDPAVNILSNGWLNYQTLACRIWGRSGFYQSGGAFGFRDQLQDVLSLMYAKPSLVREMILLCSSRQFNEGDVQHWWHPPSGRGVRTTCSDDYLWLPFVTAKYIRITGDVSILDESAHFIEGRLLNAGEESYYDLPIRSDKEASLYEHCIRAIEHGLHFGDHGLPFIGSGDWNDGMDKVGAHGKGESVWLAFFLYQVLMNFKAVAVVKKDNAFMRKCSDAAEALHDSINKNAWDGEWYVRAYFDDGSPLGSKVNEECKIDSIAQSWSVLSGAGTKERQLTAMNAAEKYLVKKDINIIQLFDPPFDKSSLNPGYIKGYVPGVRENGGQYTHAAIWLIMAFATLGDTKRTWELLQLINPINHAKDAASVQVYKVEPYVIAADIYSIASHKGRGGWTWYTGSAGWMYQLLIESFIGLKRVGEKLYFSPCIPEEWPSVTIQYCYLDTTYNIKLSKSKEDIGTHISVDGIDQEDNFITLMNDAGTHTVIVISGNDGEKTVDEYETKLLNLEQPPAKMS